MFLISPIQPSRIEGPMSKQVLQQLQVPRNLIYHTLWRRSNSQDGQTARVDLRPASILDHLSGETHIEGFPPEIHQLSLALDLHGNLGLAVLFPAGEEFALRTVGG